MTPYLKDAAILGVTIKNETLSIKTQNAECRYAECRGALLMNRLIVRGLLNLTTPTPTTGVTVVKFARIFFAKMTYNFGLIALEKNVGRH
jgi:hypothetical protein